MTIHGGNIGIPVFDHMEEVGEDTKIVCELSCHQLEYMTVSPHIGILTNLHEEHLDHIFFQGKPLSEVLTPRMKADLYYFEGNAQAFRLVTKLHYLVDETGMNLTYALLNHDYQISGGLSAC